MKKQLLLGLLVLAIAAGLIVASTDKTKTTNVPAEAQDLKIGISLPLTGSLANMGESAKKGIELAATELKNQNPNQSVQYYIEDNAFDAKASVAAYQKLKNSEHVHALITATSPASMATLPLAKADNMLQMAIFTTAPAYATPGDLSYRVSAPAVLEAGAIISYLKKFSAKHIALLYINNDFGQGTQAAFSGILSKDAGEISVMSNEAYAPGTTDFKTQLTKVKAANPDSVVLIATAADVVTIRRQAKELGLQSRFVATRSASDPTVLNTAPKDVEGLIIPDVFNPGSPDPATKNFVQSYKEKYGQLPNSFAAEGYEAFRLVAQVLEECKDNAECTKTYFGGLKSTPSLFGPLSFDTNGDPAYAFFMKVFTAGAFKVLE